jgi:multidrug transporter EmrE-like cation transporter
MRTISFWLCGAMFIMASATSGIILKIAAENAGRTALWYFILGNVIGVLCPVALTFGLKYGHPNVAYAVCFGGAFALLQIFSFWLFKQPLSSWQWAGLISVALGIFLLQIRGS